MKQMGPEAEKYYFGEHAQERPHLKELHLNSNLNDAKEATRQSTRNRKKAQCCWECECLRNKKKTSVACAQGGTMWDEVRIISHGSNLENFVRKLNFILNAIKILRKVITWKVQGFGFSLKDLPGSPGEWIGRREIQNQGSRCRTLVRWWQLGLRGWQWHRIEDRFDLGLCVSGFDSEVRERN